MRLWKKRRREAARRKKRIAAALMGTAIAVLLLLLVGVNVSNFLKLNEEMEKIRTTSLTDGRIDMEIHTTGVFAETEQLIKQYMNNYMQELGEMTELLNDEAYTAILTEANLQSDAPDFSQSRACLEQKRTACQEGYARLAAMVSEEEIQALANGADMGALSRRLSSYYMERLRVGLMYSAEDFAEASDRTNSHLDQKEAVLDFLSVNYGYWHCDGGSLVFDIPQLTQQYNALVNSAPPEEIQEGFAEQEAAQPAA